MRRPASPSPRRCARLASPRRRPCRGACFHPIKPSSLSRPCAQAADLEGAVRLQLHQPRLLLEVAVVGDARAALSVSPPVDVLHSRLSWLCAPLPTWAGDPCCRAAGPAAALGSSRLSRGASRVPRRRRRRRGTLLAPRDSLLLPRAAAGPAARQHGSPAQVGRGAHSQLSRLCKTSTGGETDRAARASPTTATSRRSRGWCSCRRTAPSRSAACAHGRERLEGFIGWKQAPLQGRRRGEARRAHRRGDGEAGRRKCLTFSC